MATVAADLPADERVVIRADGLGVKYSLRLTRKQIIRDSGLNVIPANDLSDGAEKIVKAVRGAA